MESVTFEIVLALAVVRCVMLSDDLVLHAALQADAEIAVAVGGAPTEGET